MAQVIVELSGDERKVLESYRKAAEADKKLRESTGATAAAGAKAANEFADNWTKGAKAVDRNIEAMLAQIRKTGPEGRKAADGIGNQRP